MDEDSPGKTLILTVDPRASSPPTKTNITFFYPSNFSCTAQLPDKCSSFFEIQSMCQILYDDAFQHHKGGLIISSVSVMPPTHVAIFISHDTVELQGLK